jgi:ketosteroid isomerase-like protein
VADPNILTIERAFEPWSRGDFDTAGAFHEQVEFVTDYPERQVHNGIAELRTAWDDFTSAWSDFSVAAEETIALDDGRYLVLVRLNGRGSESGLPIEQAGANIVGLDGDLIRRFELYFDRERGLAAAGVTD